MVKLFIERKILSIVISILILLLGLISLVQLPITQFPEIAPPEVTVTTKYTGANAEACVKAVVTPLERAINGVPGMLYMTSVSGNDGTSVVQIVFRSGTDPDVAAVNVQNRVSSTLDELPEEVIKAGVLVEKVQNSMLMYLNILSTDSLLDEAFLYNFTDINILPELKRIEGVGFADIMGMREYAMRVWLKPDKLRMYNLSASEIIRKLKEQNVEAAPGKIGESSGKLSQSLQFVLKYTGKLNTVEAYENLVMSTSEGGELVRLKDVAHVEFGSQEYDVISKENGKPSAAIMIKQRPGTNAQNVIAKIKERMSEIKERSFAPGMDYTVSYDVSVFLNASIKEVIKTLIEAFILVALVVFIFLQDGRSTLIPILAIPVSLIGTFFFMQLLDFSLNMITLFALVLAIGIVVDNAIVVVEAVHAKLESSNLTVKKATEEAMSEITPAIIGITLVMSAVFIPVSFLEGPTGIFYRQFSLTMAISILLSGITALTLTPALCVMLLRKSNLHHSDSLAELKSPPASVHDKSFRFLGRFFHWFNGNYNKIANKYSNLIRIIANRRAVTWLTLLAFCIGIGLLSVVVPSGFIPNEDQGAIYANITAPTGATLERTDRVVNEIQQLAQQFPEIESVSSLSGYSVISEGVGSVYGMNLMNLKNWSERELSDQEIIRILEKKSSGIKDANIEFFTPPPVPGYGNSSGFELRLLDKSGKGNASEFQNITDDFVKKLNDRPEIENAFTTYNAKFPQYLLHIDGDKAAQNGVTAENAMSTLQTLIGSEYATNFIKFGQLYRVMVQSLPEYRSKPDDILQFTIKNEFGTLVPYSTFLKIEKVYGPEQITRYNMFPSSMINGQPARGYSSGQAIEAVKEVANQFLPKNYGYDWAGSSRDQANSGGQTVVVFAISLIFVYLLLSAQYESFVLPFPVLISLPAGIFGAYFFLWLLGLESNIYAQISLIMLIGILGKNAILIIEFAVLKQSQGMQPMAAVVEAATDRLRPILMTSFAFIAGLFPLLLASGAGKIGNNTIGASSVGGMLLGTVFGVIIIPGLFIIFSKKR